MEQPHVLPVKTEVKTEEEKKMISLLPHEIKHHKQRAAELGFEVRRLKAITEWEKMIVPNPDQRIAAWWIRDRVLKLQMQMSMPMGTMMKYLYLKVDEASAWFTGITGSRRVYQITSHTDIIYLDCVCGQKKRDYVLLRETYRVGDNIMLSFKSTCVRDVPEYPPRIRGYMGPSFFELMEITPTQCQLTVYLEPYVDLYHLVSMQEHLQLWTDALLNLEPQLQSYLQKKLNSS